MIFEGLSKPNKSYPIQNSYKVTLIVDGKSCIMMNKYLCDFVFVPETSR